MAGANVMGPRRHVLAAAVLLLAAGPAAAQEAGGTSLDALLGRLLAEQQHQTVLDLDETARREVPQDELSATLMIEIPETRQIRSELDRLIGIDEHVFLDVGDQSVRASFDSKQFESDRISAVQYVRFQLGPTLACKFCDRNLPVSLRVDHPNYRASTPIQGDARESLIGDLSAGELP